MNLKTILFTAVTLTLPASLLCAQESATPSPQTPVPPVVPGQTNPPPPPPASPEGQRPQGQRGGGPGDGRHMGPSLFNMLDTNHDGVIDAEELKNAPEVLKKLDRRGDGKITPDEFFPQGGGRGMGRPPGDNGQQGGPQGREARPPQEPRGEWNHRPGFEPRGPQGPGANGAGAPPPNAGPQSGGPGAGPQGREGDPQAQWEQRWEQRRQQFEAMRQRFEQRRQEMEQRFAQNGAQPGQPGPQQPWHHGWAPNAGPQAGPQGPGEYHHHHGEFGPQPGPGFAQNGPQFGPQGPWMHHRHHHGEFGPQQGGGFAQNGGQFGPQGPWAHQHHHHGECGPQEGQGFAQDGRQYGPQGPWMHRGPGGPDFRRFSHRWPPQDGRHEFRPPPRGSLPGGPAPQPEGRRPDQSGMNPPGNPGGPQPQNRGPAGHGPANFQPHFPHLRPPFTGDTEPGEGGAAGPQGDPAPELQPDAPAPNDFGGSALPAEPGDVI